MLVDELVELGRHRPEVEVLQRPPDRVRPDRLQRGDQRRDVGPGGEEAEVDEVAGHAVVVLVDGVDDGVDLSF